MGIYINGKNMVPMGLLGQISANSISALDAANYLSTVVKSLGLSVDKIELSSHNLDDYINGISSLYIQQISNQLDENNDKLTDYEGYASDLERQNNQFLDEVDYLSDLIHAIPGQIAEMSVNVKNVVSIDILTSDNLFTGVNTFSNGISAVSLSANTGLPEIYDNDILFFMRENTLYSVSYENFKNKISALVGA